MRRNYIKLLCALATAFAFASKLQAAETAEPPTIQRFIAVDNVCAWPQLTVLRDGTLSAVLHNKPAHGGMEGDVECWTSSNGEFWKLAGTPTRHEPDTIRMNHAAGLAKNGDLIVLCSGWTNVKQPQRPKQANFRDDILSSWVCRSADGGRTWSVLKEFPEALPGWSAFIPFGPVCAGEDGALHASCYAGEWTDPAKSTKTKQYRAWHFRSDDDGRTWKQVSVIGEKHNETSLLHLGGKRWLAAARIDAVELFRSEDDGVTWQGPQRVTARNEINAHLLRLADGRLLLTYGNRIKDQYGVLAKLSSDEGATWGDPVRLVHTLNTDCGYPSSVQRPDGKVVTAWYAKGVLNHDRYHMGVAIWDAPGK